MAARKQKQKATARRSLQPSRPPSSLKSWFGLRTILVLAISFVLALLVRWVNDNPIGIYHHAGSYVDWDSRREKVKDAFITSWDAYFTNAWG